MMTYVNDGKQYIVLQTPGELVAKMARLARESGCEGVVCSPKELIVVGEVAPDLVRCTPGIRIDDTRDDQVRTATPEDAQNAHAHVRGVLGGLLGAEQATRVRVIYGGSVKADNAAALF